MDERTREAAGDGTRGSKGGSTAQDAAETAEEVNPKVSHKPAAKEAPAGTESETGETPPGLGPTGPETESNPSPS